VSEKLEERSQKFKSCPFPTYARLRTAGPVTKVVLSNGLPCWISTSHEASRSLLNDARLSKNSAFAGSDWHTRHSNWDGTASRPVFDHLLTMDRPDHSRLRRLVARSFSRPAVAALQPQLVRSAGFAVVDLPVGVPFDAVDSLAVPYPLDIISQLLGVPIQDRHEFQRWSQLLMSARAGEQSLVAGAAVELTAYLASHAKKLSVNGSSTLFRDLHAARHRGEISDSELAAMGFIILVAGHETMSGLISLSLIASSHDNSIWPRLRADPSYVDLVVEEFTRLCSPIDFATPRFARENIDDFNVYIPQGSVVYIGIAAATRDPALFNSPDNFNPERFSSIGDRRAQIAFGYGPHRCLGEHLARAETAALLQALAGRFSSVEILADDQTLPWAEGMLMRNVEALPVILHP
jgi:cytochrome P450